MMRFCITLIGVCLLLTGVVLSAELPKPIIDQDYRNYSTPQIKLGQVLFYDRVLSGTYRVSCATCHNHDRGSSNGFRLDGKDTATGGDDLAINGLAVYDALKPSSKHAPTLFNLGAKEFTVLFLDGRVARDKKGNLISPSSGQLPSGLRDVLAVQALFPAVTGDELIGKV
ncbi:MAG: cytochrome-c peroxidase, partial [Rhizobiaceae bacterium]